MKETSIRESSKEEAGPGSSLNASIPGKTDVVGWLYYDGECPLCCAIVRSLGHVFVSRRFGLRTLQTTGAAQKLGVTEEELLREVRVLWADGRSVGGADALVEIARHIWWAWPLWLVGRLSSVMILMRAVYRKIANNRYCLSGVCRMRPHRGWSAYLPLLLFPALALAIRESVAPWIFMWLIAFAIYVGCKWLTFRDGQGAKAKPKTRLLYLFLWPGMSLREFAGPIPAEPGTRGISHWFGPAARTALGAILVWVVVRFIPAESRLMRGWAGMIGTILMLHFGLFHLLALFLQNRGLNAQVNMRSPTLARSLADFWGNRWNTAFNELAYRYGFRLLTPRIGPRAALAVVFLASGLLHELVITLPARGGYGLPTAYFALSAAGIFLERLTMFRGRPLLKRLFAWVVLVGPIGLLFPPVFIHNVILPMLHAFGATGI